MTQTNPKVLIGNSFPLTQIRRRAEILPCPKKAFPQDAEIYSFWGHANTLRLAGEFLGVDLTPREERPAIALSPENFPVLYGEEFRECWIVSPNYVKNFRAKIGEEITADKIRDWSILKIVWC